MPPLARLGLARTAFVLTYELTNFARDLSNFFFSLCVFRMSETVGKLLFNSAIWGFEPAQSQFRCKIIHHHFICLIFPCKPAPNRDDPVFIQLSGREFGETPSASEIVPLLLHALVLEECIDDRSGTIFARIAVGHLGYPSPSNH